MFYEEKVQMDVIMYILLIDGFSSVFSTTAYCA